MNPITLVTVLNFGNLVLASANVIIGFSLLVYVLTHNMRSSVARAFCALSAFITIIYLVDVSMTEVQSLVSANIWLRVQWLGIAFIPAAYMHFSDALLRTTGELSRWRRVLTWASYVIGLAAVIMVFFCESLVSAATQTGSLFHLVAGKFFWVFAIYYLFTTITGWFNTLRARKRCLTSTSRRRMSYLLLTFAVPSIGVFPYLLIPTTALSLSSNAIEGITLIGNLGVALVTIVIAYIVAYQGVLLPDRVVKHSLIHYLLRGPLVAILMIVIMLIIPRVEQILGLPRDTVLIVAVAGSIVILQLAVNLAKPAIDRLIYRRDRQEITLIQTLETRLLTSTDLEQLLENTLIALCDLWRVPAGFIVTIQETRLRLRVFCGPQEAAVSFLEKASIPHLLDIIGASRPEEFIENSDLVPADGHWLLSLRNPGSHAVLGILGIKVVGEAPNFEAEQLDAAYGLVRRLELAIEDMALQQQVFGVLQSLEVELDRVREWRSLPTYAGSDIRNPRPGEHEAGFSQTVKDALSQLWGGPKLTQSPLLGMRVVRDRLVDGGSVPAKAIRSVLQEAIERLRPSGDRSMTSGEWILYNILDLRFVQGQRIRDVAQRLAMSESDFYRKQRVAIDQVADTLIQMENINQQQVAKER
jgi:hypothetical protein